ncbi:hypothetical protein BABINDRAFT_160311 [Babjeviella inositovora NRRL Y-12698]|uniref:tRNA (adenine(58)-N(1))-methyltransferase catalytic subunit TRM61 n=1 Tax=Babjeviella inositovora NRRL Y-12698 TaxID=984486 RepID=A0A1E3QYE0_9ASCO|nr:uncharacterized protein BABINDRAFT_160311 [Babjeviella inositovora NRRL Y-12698]ODQ82132.1 hypothetical protein BABINDRAFT_160311 [Babjeviella inositovora NRRL Y-12698]
MSFTAYKDTIEEGDFVFCWISREIIKPIHVKAGEVLGTRFGIFSHDDMIGSLYGAQISSAKGYGFIHLLHPSPELWTLSLPHRTQIVYTPDSSYITQRLGITVGTRVIEAGTGSASFSHSFARTIGREGKLFTYEFHEPRYVEAKQELEEHGLTNVEITHRDVCNGGFEIEENGASKDIRANAVFLDLPSPWTAIPNLSSVISKDSRVGVCCFSPCIEQVTKTVEALMAHGWSSIEMVEVSAKRWEARKQMVRRVDDAVERLRDVKRRKDAGIQRRKDDIAREALEGTEPSIGDKRPASETPQPEEKTKETGFNPFGKGVRVRDGDPQWEWINVSKVESDIKSHTSYLTFAYMDPNIRVVNPVEEVAEIIA